MHGGLVLSVVADYLVTFVRFPQHTYTVLVNCVAKAKLSSKARIAALLLKRMKDVALHPSNITYNNSLNACAYASESYEDQKEISDMATMIFIEAKGSVGANYITYGNYIRVNRFFVMDDFERWRLIRNVFRKCRADGQETDSVMRQIKPGIREHCIYCCQTSDLNTGERLGHSTRNARRLRAQPTQRKKFTTDSPLENILR
jgi:hypothetical protein